MLYYILTNLFIEYIIYFNSILCRMQISTLAYTKIETSSLMIAIVNFKWKRVNLPNWRTFSELDKSAYHICTNEELSKICIPINALLCKQSRTVLFIVKILMYFITILFVHLKHSALIAYLCLNQIRLLLFVS